MRATTIFHPVLVLGTAPYDAVLAAAYASRARAPYRPLTIVLPQARVDTMREAAPPGSTVLGYEGRRFSLDNISVRGLAARLSASEIHQILIVGTSQTVSDYDHVVRAARRFGAFPRDIRLAQVAGNGTVTITPVILRRLHEATARVMRFVAGPIGTSVLGIAGAIGGLGLAHPAAPWLLLLTAHLLTAVSQWISWNEYAGSAGVHLQLARRTGSGEPFGYDAGRDSAGSSSPLWTLVLATFWFMGVRRHLERAAKVAAAVFAHLALAGLAVAAHRWLGPGPAWGLAPLLLATLPWFHVWTARAMDTSLAVLACTLACGVTLSAGTIPASASAVIFAGAFLVRWEHAALLAPMFLLNLWQGGVVLLWAPVPILVVAAWHLRTGSPVPAATAARRRAAWTAGPDAGVSRWPDAVHDLVLSKPALALATVVGIAATGIRLDPAALAMAASLAIGALFFSLVVPATDDERRLMPLMPGYILLAVSVVQIPPGGMPRDVAFLFAGGLAIERIASLVRGWPTRRQAAARGHRYERAFRSRVAADIESRLPESGILACIEVDLWWFMRRADTQIVGLDGTLDATVAPAARSGRFGDLLRRRAVSHLLIEENLHDRTTWRDTDLHPLVGRQQSLEIPGAGRLMPVRAWAYRNWGDGAPVRWVLWELAGDTMALPPVGVGASAAPHDGAQAADTDFAVAA